MKRPSKQLIVNREEYTKLVSHEMQRPRLMDLLKAGRELRDHMQDPSCTEELGSMLLLSFISKVKSCQDIQ